MLTDVASFLKRPLYSYSKNKNLLLKAVLPFMIIVHHIEFYTRQPAIGFAHTWGDVAVGCFFAMSGYGLMASFLRRENYLDGFLRNSLIKLFVPFVLAFVLTLIYCWQIGVCVTEIDYKGGIGVPFSWFIFALALFYAFFFVVFRFVQVANEVRVLIVCLLVGLYCVITREFGLVFAYIRCPAFCIGMFVALAEGKIHARFVWWHAFLSFMLTLLLLVGLYLSGMTEKHSSLFSFVVPVLLFLLLYIVPELPTSPIVRFLSSISLEMYLVQYFPIHIALDYFGLVDPFAVVLSALSIDLFLAFIVKIAEKPVLRMLRQSS